MGAREHEPRAGKEGPAGYPAYRSHFWPRTGAGRKALIVFLFLFALTQPPFVHAVANRITPWILGLPFLYAWLLGVYVLLIAVLIHAMRRDL
jgi:hypothetical protein